MLDGTSGILAVAASIDRATVATEWLSKQDPCTELTRRCWWLQGPRCTLCTFSGTGCYGLHFAGGWCADGSTSIQAAGSRESIRWVPRRWVQPQQHAVKHS